MTSCFIREMAKGATILKDTNAENNIIDDSEKSRNHDFRMTVVKWFR